MIEGRHFHVLCFYLTHFYPVQALHWSCCPNFMVWMNFALTTWSLILMLSSSNYPGEFESLSCFNKYLKNNHITDSCSTSNIIFHSNNIIIDLPKVRTQKIHAGLLININDRVQVGELT